MNEKHSLTSNPGKRPLSILHILAPADVGGLETVVAHLTSEQRRREHAVAIAIVIAPGQTKPPSFAGAAQGAVPVYAIEVGSRAYLEERRQIERLCRELHPDVVHTHGFRPDILDAPVAHRVGAASVSTVHGFIGGTWRGRVYEWLQQRSYRHFDAVIAVSHGIRARLLDSGVPGDRVHVVPNAIRPSAQQSSRNEARRALRLPEEQFIIGWIGRLSHEKGLDVMLKAMVNLEPDVWLSVLGTGRENENLRRLASTLDIEGRVRWHGLIPNATDLLSAFDVIALTSRTEGTPMVLLEAMHAQVPIVATRVGGIPDVVTTREASLIPPEDPAAVADGVREVRSDHPAAMQRAIAAKRCAEERYDVVTWADKYDHIYRQALRALTLQSGSRLADASGVPR